MMQYVEVSVGYWLECKRHTTETVGIFFLVTSAMKMVDSFLSEA